MFFTEVDSTNSEGSTHSGGWFDGLVVVAEHQTAGRGGGRTAPVPGKSLVYVGVISE